MFNREPFSLLSPRPSPRVRARRPRNPIAAPSSRRRRRRRRDATRARTPPRRTPDPHPSRSLRHHRHHRRHARRIHRRVLGRRSTSLARTRLLRARVSVPLGGLFLGVSRRADGERHRRTDRRESHDARSSTSARVRVRTRRRVDRRDEAPSCVRAHMDARSRSHRARTLGTSRYDRSSSIKTQHDWMTSHDRSRVTRRPSRGFREGPPIAPFFRFSVFRFFVFFPSVRHSDIDIDIDSIDRSIDSHRSTRIIDPSIDIDSIDRLASIASIRIERGGDYG